MSSTHINLYALCPDLELPVGPISLDKCKASLEFIIETGNAVREDIHRVVEFLPLAPQPPWEKGLDEFIDSCEFYLRELLENALTWAKDQIDRGNPDPAHQSEGYTNLNDREVDARNALLWLETDTQEFRLWAQSWGYNLSVPRWMHNTERRVPTASPHQLAYELMLQIELTNLPVWIFPGSLWDFARGQRHHPLPGYNIQRPGRPTMFCILSLSTQDITFPPPNSKRHKSLLGANDIHWPVSVKRTRTVAKAFKAVTRTLRDARLRDIQGPAQRAFDTLEHLENGLYPYTSGPDAKVTRRVLAVDAMLNMPQFLRGANNCVAFTVADWQFRKPCYFCQGMMGFRASGRDTIAQMQQDGAMMGEFEVMKWNKRRGHPHSCAEVEVRLKGWGFHSK